ncbi:MAG: cytochrome c oxidase subunit 3 [Cytophagales bacterium]|nr:cytochrome c oxidase subunit 3 [Cytophagales bacterium]
MSAETLKNSWMGGVSPVGVANGKLMMWYFIVGDAFTFAAFLVAYGFVRDVAPAYTGLIENFSFSDLYWPVADKVFNAVPFLHGVNAPLIFVGIMTFILILSSVTMVFAVEAAERKDVQGIQKWMLWTLVGGIAFLGCQAWEWTHFIIGTHEGTLLSDGTLYHGASLVKNQYGPQAFAAFFFFITGFHGFHVFTGVLLNFIVLYQASTGTLHKNGRYPWVENVGLYWHFVDLVWVFVFTFFYLI